MINLIKKTIWRLGVDGAIFYTSMGRGIQAAGGLFTIFFIAVNLTGDEQGYYYTFGSILAIQVFFELGLGGIIIQYVAHEAAHLKYTDRGHFTGPFTHISRLASLLRFCAKWYLVLGALLSLVLVVCGFFFFSGYGKGDGVIWKTPWIVLSLSTSLNLIVSPFVASMEGLGKVREVARMRFFQQAISILCVWAVLVLGGKLFASTVASLTTLVVSLVFLLLGSRKRILLLLWRIRISDSISYVREIFPYQWKIALSWMSGYLIFQLFNPVLFAYQGAAVAGQMGMTLAALNGVMSLTLSWTTTKVPLWSGFIARGQYAELDTSFNRTLKQSSLINASCLLLFIVFVSGLQYLGLPLGGRFLPAWLCAVLMVTIFTNNAVNAWATYLRCHKREPFLVQSIVTGVLCALSTFLFGKYIGVDGVIIGYTFISVFVGLSWGYYNFKTKKCEWHD